MATITASLTTIDANSSARAQIVAWTPLTSVNVDGSVFSQSAFYVDKSVQVVGTFGGATVALRGSNVPTPGPVSGTDWFTLHKTDQNSLSFTGADGFTMLDNPVHIAPFVTGGDGTTSLSVYLLCATSARK